MHCRVITTLPYTSQRLAYESSIIEKQFINCEKCIYLNLIVFQNTIFSTGYVDFDNDNGTTTVKKALQYSKRVKYHYQHLSSVREAIRSLGY